MLDIEKDIAIHLQDPEKRRKAFSQVVSLYGEKLYWQIRKMVLNHDDADDLLQNTFLKAWTNLDYFRGEAKISTWLFKIAINECITFLNKQRTQNNISIDDTDVFLLERLRSDEHFCGDDIQRKLQEAIALLPDKQRLVFNMKYFDDMKYEEMSEILGTSVGALKASYKIEDNNLKNKLKENPFSTPEGYLEGLTDRIMKQIPEETHVPEAQQVSLLDRLRPFLYMAAMFAGLGLFFKTIARFDSSHTDGRDTTSLLVRSSIPADSKMIAIEASYDEDEEFLHYLENQYTDALIQESLDGEDQIK